MNIHSVIYLGAQNAFERAPNPVPRYLKAADKNCYDSERLKTRLLTRSIRLQEISEMSNVAVPPVPQSRTSNGPAGQADRSGGRPRQRINKVAVLGAGTMGARIAAHFANAGV